MIYLVDPNEMKSGTAMDCRTYCGIKPLYGVPWPPSEPI